MAGGQAGAGEDRRCGVIAYSLIISNYTSISGIRAKGKHHIVAIATRITDQTGQPTSEDISYQSSFR